MWNSNHTYFIRPYYLLFIPLIMLQCRIIHMIT